MEASEFFGVNISAAFRVQLRAALDGAKSCGIDRFEAAKRMSKSLSSEDEDVTITKPMIDKFVAPSAEGNRFPLEYLPAFCEAVESDDLLIWLADRMGRVAISREQGNVIEYFNLMKERDRINRKLAEMKGNLPEKVT